MKKTFTLLIAASAAILMMAQPKMVVGQTRANLELTFSFTSNPGSWPTSNPSSATDVTYTIGSTSYTFNLNTNAKYSTSPACVFLTGAGGALGMPAISGYKLVKVEATNTSGCSTAVTVGISTSNSSFSAVSGGSAQTWRTQSHTYTYTLTGTSVNTMYYLYDNKSGKNAQVASLKLTYEPASCNPPTFLPAAGAYTTTQSVTISSTTDGATIYYTTDGTTPTTSSLTAQPVSVASSMTIKAIAVKAGLANSSVSEAAYTISQAQNLTISSAHGTPTVTVNSSPVTPTAGVYSIPQGATVNLSVAAASGYAFTGWTSSDVTIINNAFTMPNNAVAITANYSQVKEDELTVSWTGVTGTTYTAWSGKSVDGGSGAVYAGKTNKNDNGIGFRTSGNEEGIVTTTSGGYVRKVSVTWKTSTDRTLQVYGKNSAYSAASDLFSSDSDTQGTLLGSIEYGKSTEITITGNYQFVGLRSSDSYLSVEPITITWQPVTMYSISCQTKYYKPETEIQIGAVTINKTSAPAGETINLTAEGMNHYHFNSWTVTNTTASQAVSVTGTTSASFTMPAGNVTVAAAWAEDTKYTISKASGSADHITVAANSYADETVNVQIHDLPDGKVVDKVTVTPASSDAFYATFTGQEAGNYNYSFTMPAENVTLSVSFKDPEPVTVTYYVKGVQDNSVSVTLGNSITLPTSTTTVSIDGYSLLGWCATSGSTTPLLTGSYTPEGNVSLYAVLGVTSNASLTITPSTSGLPTSYQSANTFVKYTLEGKDFYIQQGYKNGEKLQWRASGNSNGTGTIYNNDNFGRITSIVLVYDASDTGNNFTMKAGTSANPSSGTTIAQSYNSTTHVGTFDLSGGNYTHFVMTNGTSAGYLKSITINYVASATVGTVTEITAKNASRDTDIEATECVVIKDGGILTFTGTNKGNASNIIIEDGGQLIHTSSVNATLKKSILKYDDPEDKDGWYTIASPANGAKVSLATTGTYDLFAYDEANHKWLNQKTAANNITMFNQAQGFLYANSADQTLIYAGSMVGTNSTVSMNLSYAATGNSLIGYNLVGNPFSRELTTDDIKVGGSALTTYYVSEGGSNLVSRAIGTYPIKPGQGFFVQATDEDQQIVFNPASKDYSYNKPAYISIEAGNSEFTDMAYVQLGEGNTLRKMSINDNTPLVYVMQDGKDYASTTVEAYKASIPVNFKAAQTGIYTINVKTTGVDMDYLHLIDRYTGEDIDLLLESKYSFLASKGDDESRFILVFTANDENINADDDIFAYQNGNSIIVSGEGELQIFDVMGRMVSTQNVNGTETINVNTQGVYIFRLLGAEIKTQKIVVR